MTATATKALKEIEEIIGRWQKAPSGTPSGGAINAAITLAMIRTVVSLMRKIDESPASDPDTAVLNAGLGRIANGCLNDPS